MRCKTFTPPCGSFEIHNTVDAAKYYCSRGYNDLDTYGHYNFQYNITDHLGNVRAVVDTKSDNVEQINNYYPFGGVMADVTTGTDVHTHKYNGKFCIAAGPGYDQSPIIDNEHYTNNYSFFSELALACQKSRASRLYKVVTAQSMVDCITSFNIGLIEKYVPELASSPLIKTWGKGCPRNGSRNV